MTNIEEARQASNNVRAEQTGQPTQPKHPKPNQPKQPAFNTSDPIINNQYVKSFVKLLQNSNAPVETMNEIINILKCITAMERELGNVSNELSKMRKQVEIAEANNHPSLRAMQDNLILALHQTIQLKDKVATLKENIINTCKNALDAVKHQGLSALNGIAGFFKIKPSLETMRNNLDADITKNKKSITKIKTLSQESRKVGQSLRNISKALSGKEANSEAKPMGITAKAFIVPYQTTVKCFEGIKAQVSKFIGCLNKLEKIVAERKPSILGTMDAHDNEIKQADKDARAATRPAPSIPSSDKDTTKTKTKPKPKGHEL